MASKSNTDTTIEFLKRDKKDAAVAAVGETAERVKSKSEQVKELNELRKRLLGYKKLEDGEKVDLHIDLAMRVNGYSNAHALSQKLTEDALKHVGFIQKDALFQLDRKLKEFSPPPKPKVVRQTPVQTPLRARPVDPGSTDDDAFVDRLLTRNGNVPRREQGSGGLSGGDFAAGFGAGLAIGTGLSQPTNRTSSPTQYRAPRTPDTGSAGRPSGCRSGAYYNAHFRSWTCADAAR